MDKDITELKKGLAVLQQVLGKYQKNYTEWLGSLLEEKQLKKPIGELLTNFRVLPKIEEAKSEISGPRMR